MAQCSRIARRCSSKVRLCLRGGASLLRRIMTAGMSTVHSLLNLQDIGGKMTNTEGRRKHRRIATMWLSQKAVDLYTPVLDFEATDMIRALHADSKNGAVHINPQT